MIGLALALDTVLTLIFTLAFAVGAGNGIIASMNELHNTHRDGKVLDQLEVTNAKRDIVKSEWWRHAIRLVGFIAFGLVAVVMLASYDFTEDISVGRTLVRLFLVVGMASMTLVAYIDRRARRRLMSAITGEPANHPRRRRND